MYKESCEGNSKYLKLIWTRYGVEVGEKVNRAYVRIIEGSYDSNRVWSALSTNNQSWNTISISTSKFNNPFESMYTYFGWTYFE